MIDYWLINITRALVFASGVLIIIGLIIFIKNPSDSFYYTNECPYEENILIGGTGTSCYNEPSTFHWLFWDITPKYMSPDDYNTRENTNGYIELNALLVAILVGLKLFIDKDKRVFIRNG